MSKPTYLASDTETGGLYVKENPLLTAYFSILDENFELVDELYLKVLPYGQYSVLTEEAMNVNKINIEEHLKVALSHVEAGKQLEEFLKKNKIGNNKLTPIGQNWGFDQNFIFEHLIADKKWQSFCTRGYLDTKRFMDILVDLDMYPSDSTSLEKATTYLGIEKGEHHDAKADTIMTVKVYQKLKNIIKNAVSAAGQTDQNLLESIE